MKRFLTAVAALTLLALAPAHALDGAAPAAGAQPAVDVRARFNDAVDALAKKAAARSATREDFARVVALVKEQANEYIFESKRIQTIQDKMIARMDALETKARGSAVQICEFDVLKDFLVDLRLGGMLMRLANHARSGAITRLEFAMIYEELNFRAVAAKDWNHDLDAVAARLRSACEAIEARGAAAMSPKEIEPLETAYAEAACHWALWRLGKRSMQEKLTKGVLTQADWTDVTDEVVESGVPAGSELHRKVNARLEELKAAAAGGRIAREDFAPLHELLMQRARAATGSGI